jgi:phage repressor protein C with HTH and peptisase S24 domain
MMGEISPIVNAHCGIFRGFRPRSNLWDNSHMAKPDIVSIRETIEREMGAKGFSRRSLSSAAGLSESAVRDLLTRTENPGIGTLYAVAEALKLPLESINGSKAVPLLGIVGAGGMVAYFKDDHETEYVPRPPLAPGRLMALQVIGDSMLPKYEPGDVVYIRRDHDGVLERDLGKHCAVNCADGGTYLKILSKGTEFGRFTLRSHNAADMENVEVIWAARVEFVMPAA